MLDIGYFIRSALYFGRYSRNKKGRDLWKESVVSGRCWPNDLDSNWHMNNARYLREADFGRFALLIDSGLWDAILKQHKNGIKNCTVLVSALQSQYRSSVELGDQFKIRSRLNGWDDSAFYLEQWMTLDKNDKTAFSLLARLAVTPRSVTPQMLVNDLTNGSIQSPPLSTSMEAFKQNYRLNFQKIQ